METDNSHNTIKCPSCGHEFPVGDAFLSQAEEKIRKEYQNKISQQAAVFNSQKQQFEKEKKEFEEKKEKENELFKETLEIKLVEQKAILEKETQEEFAERIKALEEENQKRKDENLKLKNREIQLLKKENELKEEKEEFQLKMEKELLEKRDEIATEVRKKENEKNELKFKEYEMKLDDQRKLIEEMKRKADQGSMQIQGEVQEIALEELLKKLYPFDIIEEVPKGLKGADVIQNVVNNMQQVCGKIIFESKRTKSFSETWLDKLKQDQRDQQAELAVIVTEVLPKDMDRFGRKEGVWICNYHEIHSLSFVLREMILKTYSAKSSQVNKGDKMELLYHYLTSDEFRQCVEAIVEGFSGLKIEIDKEKRAMSRIWKEREKQIEKVIDNTINMYGSIKGIAGNAIGSVKALELPGHTDNEIE
jgi:hypothetical protein